jgi:hypothetical protein
VPHFPRRQSPTTGIPAEFMRPPQAHAPIPVTAPAAAPAPAGPDARPDTPAARRRRISLGKISPRTYEPDQKQVLRTLFGKEPDVDPNTGQLVPAKPPSATGSPLWHGG